MGINRVTICASTSFSREAQDWKVCLEGMGYEILRVPTPISSEQGYEQAYRRHHESIASSDLVFVMNLDKNGVQGYIGPGVLGEIAFAIGLNVVLGKKIRICCLKDIPSGLSYSDELKRWERLGWIEKWSGGKKRVGIS